MFFPALCILSDQPLESADLGEGLSYSILIVNMEMFSSREMLMDIS